MVAIAVLWPCCKARRVVQPIGSFHSRANGKRHGITSCVEIDGRLLATSKGGHVIIELDRLSQERVRGMSTLLEMRDITKEYRGVPALKNVDFDLQLGEIHGLVGENGAGKSTLTKIMAGVTETTAGTMRLNGEHVLFKTPAEALRHGITMVFQETSLVPSMTVAQNLYLGDEKLFNRLRGIYIAAQTFLSSMNFRVDPWATVSTLGAAQKQMVEIARAVRQNAQNYYIR